MLGPTSRWGRLRRSTAALPEAAAADTVSATPATPEPGPDQATGDVITPTTGATPARRAGETDPPLAVVRRPGAYVMTDSEGSEVGVIQGDYVIGFTVRSYGRTRFIKDLDEAKAEVTREWARRQPEGEGAQAS